MTVLIIDGSQDLGCACQTITNRFLTDEDLARGIFIKPNIVFPVNPQSGEITSPALVKILVSALRERDPNVDIVIGEGVAAGCDALENFRVSGFKKLSTEIDVPLVDLHSTEYRTVSWKFGKLELPALAIDRTYINMPILKPSSACLISGALKNQKGLVLPAMKKQFHRLGLHEQIAQLNATIRPALTIMDCSRFFGCGVLIAGDNCGEIDATACDLLEIEEPLHVRLAQITQVFSKGFPVEGEELRFKILAPRPVDQDYKQIGRLRLWSNPRACTMCRYLFRDLRSNVLKPNKFSVGLKFLNYSLKGAEIIMGTDPQWRQKYPNVICVGACTRKVAKEGGFIYIPGCPPTQQDLEKFLP
jgi:uncharacterized protein (DUF362 family)